MPTYKNLPCCNCQVVWLPWLEKMAIHFGIVKNSVDFIQLLGGVAQSAGTHLKGGAADIKQVQRVAQRRGIVWLSRQMGADATWSRLVELGWTSTPEHTHSCLTGCPHGVSQFGYQINAVLAGYNGLGIGGKAGRDPYAATCPVTRRTWKQGIEWAKAILSTGGLTQTQKIQAALGLVQDNVYGPVTEHMLQTLRLCATKGKAGFDKLSFDVRTDYQKHIGTTADGVWGPATLAATIVKVTEVQLALNVTADGSWGPVTDAKFLAYRAVAYKAVTKPTPTPAKKLDKTKCWGAFPDPAAGATVGMYGIKGQTNVWAGGMPSETGVDVKYAIKQIQATLGIAVDGSFGNQTRSAVQAFQRRRGLKVDGNVGAITWSELVKSAGNW